MYMRCKDRSSVQSCQRAPLQSLYRRSLREGSVVLKDTVTLSFCGATGAWSTMWVCGIEPRDHIAGGE